MRDRDKANLNTVCPKTLRDKGEPNDTGKFNPITFRRREIENYALVPACIARTIGVEVCEIQEWWEAELYLPWNAEPAADAPSVLDGDFKEAIVKKLKEKGKTMDDLWQNLLPEEIHADLKTVISHVEKL